MTTSENKLKSTLIRAAREIERLKKRNAELEDAAPEDIAVVGIGLRLPGGVHSLAQLDDRFAAGTETTQDIPAERWQAGDVFSSEPATPGKSYVQRASFVEDMQGFDPRFFGIGPGEARSMDPQHRLLLEATWEALEGAQVVPASLARSRTGVFIGIGPSEYEWLATDTHSDAYGVAGTHASFAAGRIAYHLGLQGPALSLDTACSSSLVALHLGSASLRTRESDLVLVGGVQALLSPVSFVALSQTRALAADGQCKTFSDAADGYGRGEGVVVLALERLRDAQAKQHPVLAIVRGSAVNHDGKSSGITAPNGTSQQKVLRDALKDARLEPRDVHYVECHGTGTSLGDPIEVQALHAVYGEQRPIGEPLVIGAFKPNIGHLESAAGLAGVAKVIAALQASRIPPSISSRPRNRHIDWDSLNVRVIDTLEQWPRSEGAPRRAGVSAFGLSGTNAHVILEEAPVAPDEAREAEQSQAPDCVPLCLSGRSAEAVVALAQTLRALQGSPVDVAWSLLTTRTQFEYRAVAAVEELADLDPEQLTIIQAKSRPKLAYVFAGQGSQRVGMGEQLRDRYPALRTILDDICGRFDVLSGGSLRGAMRGDAGLDINQTGFAQPAIFALEVAQYRLLESFGVVPDVVLGHSIGEIAAAHIAGVFNLDDACKLVHERARLMQELPGGGAMASLQASEAEVREALRGFVGLDIAGLNGPLSTVVSGARGAVLGIMTLFESQGRKVKQLQVSHAFHSAQMEPMLSAFEAAIGGLEFRSPEMPVISNLSGAIARGQELSSTGYWSRHVRGAVRFSGCVESLEQLGVDHILELGARSVLSSMVLGCLSPDADISCAPLMRKGGSETAGLATALSWLHAGGLSVAWDTYFSPFAPKKIALPTYAFQRHSYWIDEGARRVAGSAGLEFVELEHPLIPNGLVRADDDGLLFTGSLSQAGAPWVSDHVVFNNVLFPGTGFLDLALAAAEQVGCEGVEELVLEAPLILAPDMTCVLQVSVGAPREQGKRAITIHSRDAKRVGEGGWTLHAHGSLMALGGPADTGAAPWSLHGAREGELDGLYSELAELGLAYGPSFRLLTKIWTLDGVYLAEARLPDAAEVAGHVIHPALFDALLHALARGSEGSVALPFAWSGVRVDLASARGLRARFTPKRASGEVRIELFDLGGRVVGTIASLYTRQASARDIREALVLGEREHLYGVRWEPTSAPVEYVEATTVEVDGGRARALTALAELEHRAVGKTIALRAGSGSPLALTTTFLELLQRWLQGPGFATSRLLVITRGAISTSLDEGVPSLGAAPLWGMVRSAINEHEGRDLVVMDLDANAWASPTYPIVADEQQFAVRGARVLVPRMGVGLAEDCLEPPMQGLAWRLSPEPRGRLDDLALIPAPAVEAELGPHEVRLQMRASGLNFRDVLNALGMYPGDPGALGGEGAGEVVAVGSEVDTVAVGDAVFGLIPASFANFAVTDARYVTPVPAGWSFEDAASVALVFLTAYFAFVDLGHLRAGERVLIHAATGGVGMAATQLARYLGAEVFGTASEPKWAVMREQGFDRAHTSNSRTLAFEQEFRGATKGSGVDVVLNALAGDFVDASLRLLAAGGRFLEMGKTDIREADELGSDLSYRAFDLMEAGPDRMQQMLRELVVLFEAGALQPLPLRTWDVRRAPAAFRHVAQAKHIGKVVLTSVPRLEGRGAVLITGGTGALGALFARHLVSEHGVRELVLSSRSGDGAPGARALAEELRRLGADVRLLRCDLNNKESVGELLSSIRKNGRLRAIVHTAGVLADGLLVDLDGEQLQRVFGPKVDGLDNLLVELGDDQLDQLVVFSSSAGLLGSPGQANYAAANAYLDAVCADLRARGVGALSLAWGPWAEVGMAAKLSPTDRERMRRSGFPPLELDEGRRLFDAALGRVEPLLAPIHVDVDAVRESGQRYALLGGLVRAGIERAADVYGELESISDRLVRMNDTERRSHVRLAIATEIAAVLGIGREEVSGSESVQALGVDSLMAVELRNRLQAVTGTRLEPTFIFDHSTLDAMTERLLEDVSSIEQKPQAAAEAHATGAGFLGLLEATASSGGLASMLASFVEMRERADQPPAVIRPIRLTTGEANCPRIYCIPSLVAPSTTLQYMRLADELRGECELWCGANPGYDLREGLPNSREVLAKAHLEAIARISDDSSSPFVILAFSSAGWVAVDLVRECERSGVEIGGLILLDTPLPNSIPEELTPSFYGVTFNYYRSIPTLDIDDLIGSLTAMSVNMGHYAGGMVGKVSTRTLFVQATGGFLGDEGERVFATSPQTDWSDLEDSSIVAVDVPHFEMISAAQAIATIAEHIRRWSD